MFILEEIFEEICVAIYETITDNVWDWWEPIIFRSRKNPFKKVIVKILQILSVIFVTVALVCIGLAIVFGIKTISNLIK